MFLLKIQNLNDTRDIAIDLTRNENQAAYFNEVMKSVAGQSPNRIFAYGGAVRGGKTFVTLFMILMLAKKYPRSRWHVVRKDFPSLEKTTIPSFRKLCPERGGVKYHRNPSNYHVSMPNGSEVHFMSENIKQDPDLHSFLGLETNGIFLEQAEELSERLFAKALERTGSWYLNPMPPGLVFLTFNPSDNWVRQKFYEPFLVGQLNSPFYYRKALPTDNPFVTQDQWNQWKQMGEIEYRRFIEGDWDAKRSGNEFYSSFSRTRHIGKVDFDPSMPVHLSFDQNVVPYITLTCWQIVIGNDNDISLRCFDEFCLSNPNNTTEKLCQAFVTAYGDRVQELFYYGDASGSKRDTRSRLTDYDIVRRELRRYITNKSDRVNRYNPPVIKRRDFINNLLDGKYKASVIIDGDRCRNLVADLGNIKLDANGHKLKEKERDEYGVSFERYGHTSDTMDYLIVSSLDNLWRRFLSMFG